MQTHAASGGRASGVSRPSLEAQERAERQAAPAGELPEGRPADGAALVAAARHGDPDALTALYLRYRPLLAGVVGRLQPGPPPGVEPADLAQEAARSFCELLRTYEPNRGVNLTTYLQKQVKWRLVNYLRAEARRAGHLPLEAAPLERLADEVAHTASPDVRSPRLARALRRLSPRQRAVVAGLYWRDRTADELARELGVTRQAVSGLRRRAEERLRRELLDTPEDPPSPSRP